ncbi:MAG: PDZ domain-containing protein [Sphingobacteriales bacterium]|nr:PDZ domain-containing protein [Sphingobacteriales bacterium]
MKKNLLMFSMFSFALVMLAPISLFAQKEEKDKEAKEKKDVQQIIITRKGDKSEKIVVEVKGDKVTINGKPLEDYKDKDGDIRVNLHNLKDLESLTFLRTPGVGTWDQRNGDAFSIITGDANRAMLGVTTEKTEGGVEIQDITKESAAERAGLKENDIITKIDDTKIEDPDDLSAAIKKHKPGDKVTVTYLRNKKEQKTTAELTKWKGVGSFGMTAPKGDFKFEMPDMDFEHIMPKIQTVPRVMTPNGQNWNWNWSGGGPKLGISVQDTDDGKGVKVIEVDDESNAEKAGIKEDDIITEVDGKAVNGADEIAKVIRESKDKVSVMIKLQRGGKTQNVEVKMPRKLKTADL